LNTNGQTALFTSLLTDEQVKDPLLSRTRTLLEAGTDPNVIDQLGNLFFTQSSPDRSALKSPFWNIEFFHLILNKGLNVNSFVWLKTMGYSSYQKTDRFIPLLDWVIYFCPHESFIQAMVTAGADLQSLDSFQQTPLFFVDPTLRDFDSQFRLTEKVQFLLQSGVPPNAVDQTGRTYFHQVFQSYFLKKSPYSEFITEVIQRLIDFGIDPLLHPEGTPSPLIATLKLIENKTISDEILSQWIRFFLVHAKANPNERDSQGTPALHLAIQAFQSSDFVVGIVRELLRAGADPNAKDAQGNSALSLAKGLHQEKIRALLLQAGAVAEFTILP
jgi:ankyrin repeat protein